MSRFFLLLIAVTAVAGCSKLNIMDQEIGKREGALKLCKHEDCMKGGFLGIGVDWYRYWPEGDAKILRARVDDQISRIEIGEGVWRFYEYPHYNTRAGEQDGWVRDFGPGVYRLEDLGIDEQASSFKRVE